MRNTVVVIVGDAGGAVAAGAADAFARRGAAVRTVSGHDCAPNRIDTAMQRLERDLGPIDICVVIADEPTSQDPDTATQLLRLASTSALQRMTTRGHGRLIHVRQLRTSSPTVAGPSRLKPDPADTLTARLRTQLEQHHAGVTLSDVLLPAPYYADAAVAAITAVARSGVRRFPVRRFAHRRPPGRPRSSRRRSRLLARAW